VLTPLRVFPCRATSISLVCKRWSRVEAENYPLGARSLTLQHPIADSYLRWVSRVGGPIREATLNFKTFRDAGQWRVKMLPATAVANAMVTLGHSSPGLKTLNIKLPQIYGGVAIDDLFSTTW
jgi:hypothetical protein